jgi:hypothetical protein
MSLKNSERAAHALADEGVRVPNINWPVQFVQRLFGKATFSSNFMHA